MQRHLRLRRQEDFASLRAHGQVWRHRLLILSVLPNGLPHNRYGFVTSKQLGHAVVRNRVRRLLREAVRGADPYLLPGHDMVFVARRTIASQPFAVVDEAVTSSLQRSGLWIEGQTS
ncbi:MAG: ribonuclease P protein component [Chloroflexi bacterium]|nr:ribonuclease P protein component [Chloroflexota bacterium]